MKKWNITILIISVLLAALSVTAASEVECELSTDNATWEDINTTKWGGSISDSEKLATVTTLEQKTDYYLRCKNSTTDWGYISIKTEDKGDTMETAIMIALAVVTIGGIYLAVHVQNTAMQIFFFLFSMFMFAVDFRFAALVAEVNDATQSALINSMLSMYNIGLILFRFMLFFAMIYLLFAVTKIISNFKNKKRQIKQNEWMGFE